MANDTSKQLPSTQAPPTDTQADRVRRLRTILGSTERWRRTEIAQRDLARAVGVSVRTATRWEAGEGEEITTTAARRIISAFEPALYGLTLDWLLLGRGKDPVPRHPLGVSSGTAPVELTVLVLLRMLADTVARAVRDVILQNELGVTREGRRAVARWLRKSVKFLRDEDRSIEATDLHELANELDPPGGAP